MLCSNLPLDNFSKSGNEYVTDAISKMCGRYDWHENILSNLIGSIKEMPLEEGEQLKTVIKKILRCVPDRTSAHRTANNSFQAIEKDRVERNPTHCVSTTDAVV